MGVLSTKRRKELPDSDFGIPSKREYPLETRQHAIAALGRVKEFGTPAEQAEVRSNVYKKYPGLNPANKTPNDRARSGKI